MFVAGWPNRAVIRLAVHFHSLQVSTAVNPVQVAYSMKYFNDKRVHLWPFCGAVKRKLLNGRIKASYQLGGLQA